MRDSRPHHSGSCPAIQDVTEPHPPQGRLGSVVSFPPATWPADYWGSTIVRKPGSTTTIGDQLAVYIAQVFLRSRGVKLKLRTYKL